jgi:hypothetical protein
MCSRLIDTVLKNKGNIDVSDEEEEASPTTATDNQNDNQNDNEDNDEEADNRVTALLIEEFGNCLAQIIQKAEQRDLT